MRCYLKVVSLRKFESRLDMEVSKGKYLTLDGDISKIGAREAMTST
jgi:hypothetical protein